MGKQKRISRQAFDKCFSLICETHTEPCHEITKVLPLRKQRHNKNFCLCEKQRHRSAVQQLHS